MTEAFLTVHPKELNAFMRDVNGLPAYPQFDPARFLASLDLARPSRSMQRRAADAVIEVVERKLTKESYKPLLDSFGYGTLIVGLPLWFATPPLYPFRPENVLDDFASRMSVAIGQLGNRYVRDPNCPFGRVVVVWETSWLAMREWFAKAKFQSLDDPANLTLSFPFKVSPLLRLYMEAMERLEARNSDEPNPGKVLSVQYECKDKKGRFAVAPPLVRELQVVLEKYRAPESRNTLSKVSDALRRLRFEVLCFLRLHGIVGLERWLSSKLPRGRIARAAANHRAVRLYRASLRRRRSAP